MKKAIIFLIFILLLTPALAKTDRVKMKIGDSRLIENINVTLLNLDEKEDKIIVCVNSQKAIVTDNEEKRVNNVRIDVRKITENYAELELQADCDDCVCGVECSNVACFPEQEIKQQTKLPNPASVYCEEQSGMLEIRTTENGSVGYCIFENFECEEWAYFRGECPKKEPEPEKTFLEKIINWIKGLF